MGNLIDQIKSVTKTIFFFSLACWLMPVLITSYVCLCLMDKCWVYLLSIKYPGYELSTSKKIRTLIDTAKTAGIFHFLLQLQGPCDFEKIKQNYINNLIEKRTKSGELYFPKLRKKLISCWGHYAWVRDDSDFDINNHIILSSRTYRGRPVSDTNIQECVSDLVQKYFPSDIPPWQVIVIPAISTTASSASESEQSENESFYVLVRIHHLLLAEDENLHINEILMLNSDKTIKVYDTTLETPKLSDFVEKPTYISNLWNHILMTISNRWNEFIYHYDPLESPDVDKKQQITCFSQLISILFITIVTVIGDFYKGYGKTNNHIKYKMRFLMNLYRREAYRRNLSIQAVLDAALFSLNPINIVKNSIRFIWWLTISTMLLSPYYAFMELAALKHLITTGQTDLTNTFTGCLSIYLPLLYCAFIEFLKIANEIVKAPKNIYEELFEYKSKEGNILQVKSYMGRKVISFSKSINMKEVRERINLDEIGDTEFIFACLAGSLYKYLQNFDHRVPKMLNTTCRSIGKKYFLEKYNKTAHIGGVIFLQLPLQEPNREQINIIHQIIERVRQKQIAIYLISQAQTKFEVLTSIIPEVWMKVFINYFSVSFPVTITEIHGDSGELETVWGQPVKDLLLFRPPQSKTCLSLNIHRFGDKSRLAVMADTILAPEHCKISSCWEENMEKVIL